MYQEHPLFISPASDATLWRYMDFTKFVSLLDKQSLYFARADKLGDPFEGSLTQVNTKMREQIYMSQFDDEEQVKQLLDLVPRNFQQFRLWMYISCWHESKHESAAMWRLYSREFDGIAIKTSFQSLKDSLVCSDDVLIGKIAYVDYSATLIHEGNAFAPYLHKREGFRHEEEVRAICMRMPSEGSSSETQETTHEDGIYLEVDLSQLIEAVVVAPYAETWFIQLVRSIAAKYDLSGPIVQSSFAEEPAW